MIVDHCGNVDAHNHKNAAALDDADVADGMFVVATLDYVHDDNCDNVAATVADYGQDHQKKTVVDIWKKKTLHDGAVALVVLFGTAVVVLFLVHLALMLTREIILMIDNIRD